MASFNSNNPFRRKAPASSAPPAPPLDLPPFDEFDTPPNPTPETAPALPPADRFRNELQTLSTSNHPPPATSFQKPKVVKRVRVQSPPPSSPDSPDASVRFPPVGLDDDESSSSSSSDETDEQYDPFAHASAAGSADVSDREDVAQPMPVYRPPPNPFQKTLRDLEVGVVEPGERPASAPATRAALDVGAFGRLLLTGQTGTAPSTLNSPPVPSNDSTGVPGVSSPPRQHILDALQIVRETSQTSGETSEVDDERRGLVSRSQTSLQPAPTIVKKKPPPPSSRHGKLIKPDGAEPPLSSPTRRAATMPLASPSRKSPPTPSDLHKPLPAPPQRSPREKDAESVFDREAAGKAPEVEIQPGLNIIMPTSPPSAASQANPSAPASTPQPPKKPVPPPRRQPHGRSESRVASSAASILTQQDDTDTSLRRSSFDSTRSRSSSLRVSVHAPAPPPPRRTSQQNTRNVGAATPISPPLSTGEVAVAVVVAAAEPSPLTGAHTLSASPAPIGDAVVSPPSTIPPPAVAAVPTIVPTPGPLVITGTPAPTAAPGPTATPAPQGPITTPGPPTTGKLIPPPPPPARNASVRAKKRPVSTIGVLSSPQVNGGLLSRKSSGNGKEPPPPVPRHRERAVSTDGVAVAPSAADGGAAGGLLADLSALQREVDALRGRVEGPGS